MGQCVSTAQSQQSLSRAAAGPHCAPPSPAPASTRVPVSTPATPTETTSGAANPELSTGRVVLDYDDPLTQTADVIPCPSDVRVALPAGVRIGETKYGHALFATRSFEAGDVVYSSSYRVVRDVKPNHPITIRVYPSRPSAEQLKADDKLKAKKQPKQQLNNIGADVHTAKRYVRKPAAAPAPAPAPAPAAPKPLAPAPVSAPAPAPAPAPAAVAAPVVPVVAVTALPLVAEEKSAAPVLVEAAPTRADSPSSGAATATASVEPMVEPVVEPVFEFELDLHTHAVRHRTGLRRMYSFDSMTNHSCAPHTFEHATAEQRAKGRFSVIACRPIRAGDEIHTDYALYEADCRDKGISACGCGTSSCRGSVAGFLYLTPAQQLALIASGQCVPDMFALVLGVARRAKALGLTVPPASAATANGDGHGHAPPAFVPTAKAQEIAPVAVDERVVAAMEQALAAMPERGITSD